MLDTSIDFDDCTPCHDDNMGSSEVVEELTWCMQQFLLHHTETQQEGPCNVCKRHDLLLKENKKLLNEIEHMMAMVQTEEREVQLLEQEKYEFMKLKETKRNQPRANLKSGGFIEQKRIGVAKKILY
jgi:hypothetical protein